MGPRTLSVLGAALAVILTLPPGRAVEAQRDLPVATIEVGGHAVRVQVARTDRQRETGLMGRTKLSDNHGMLFVFRHPQIVCMWMKDTPLPLSIAFIAPSGAITNTADMKPETLDAHCSSGLADGALEMPLGWFAQHSAGVGAKVESRLVPDDSSNTRSGWFRVLPKNL